MPQFYAIDILYHRGRKVLRLPLEERRALLPEALAKHYPSFQSVRFDVTHRIQSNRLFPVEAYSLPFVGLKEIAPK